MAYIGQDKICKNIVAYTQRIKEQIPHRKKAFCIIWFVCFHIPIPAHTQPSFAHRNYLHQNVAGF